MGLLIDFVLFTAIGLGGDWLAFQGLKDTAGAFWPMKMAYKDTPLRRLVLVPIGVGLFAYAAGPEVSALAVLGLTLLFAPIAILTVWLIRQHLRARPRD